MLQTSTASALVLYVKLTINMLDTLGNIAKYILGAMLVIVANIWVFFMGTLNDLGESRMTIDWWLWLTWGATLAGVLLIFRPKTRKASLYFLSVPVILAIAITLS